MVKKVNLELLVRDGCHLCEQAFSSTRKVLVELGGVFPDAQLDLRLTEVDSDADLVARFSDEVPVLFVNGEQRAFLRVDEERLKDHLVQILS